MESPASSSSIPVKEEKKLKLTSPYPNADPICFYWNSDPKKSVMPDILEMLRAIFKNIPEIKDQMDNAGIMENLDFNSYDRCKAVTKKFCKIANSYRKSHFETTPPSKDYASSELLRMICTKAYNRAVDNEKQLNKHYEAFSSQTYGETSYERMAMIIEEIKPTENDIFVDLGSGVGQLVVQMAGGTKIRRCAGIEVSDLPAKFASNLEREFKTLMRWFAKKYRPFTLYKGDFLGKDHRKFITGEATIIFINNFAFTADLETSIKQELLAELKDGVRIITTKPYATPNRNLTGRHMNDISAILDVQEMRPCPNSCSWTSNYVPYYIHTVNRAKLEHYFACLKNPALRESSRSHTPSAKTSRESTVVPGNNGVTNGDITGPTTRRKWIQQVEEDKKKRAEVRSDGSCPDEDTRQSLATPSPMPGPSVKPNGKSVEPTTSSTVEEDDKRAANIVDTIDCVVLNASTMSKQNFANQSSDIDMDLLSPTRKRSKKESKESPGGQPSKTPTRGRPRKNAVKDKAPKKMSQETKEGIELMHKMSAEACKTTANSMDLDPSFILTDVINHVAADIKTEYDGPNSRGKYPNVDKFCDDLRIHICQFLDQRGGDLFYQPLMDDDNEDPGVKFFKTTIKAQGIDLERPRNVVQHARDLIAQYNDVIDASNLLLSRMNKLETVAKTLISSYQQPTPVDTALLTPAPKAAPAPAAVLPPPPSSAGIQPHPRQHKGSVSSTSRAVTSATAAALPPMASVNFSSSAQLPQAFTPGQQVQQTGQQSLEVLMAMSENAASSVFPPAGVNATNNVIPGLSEAYPNLPTNLNDLYNLVNKGGNASGINLNGLTSPLLAPLPTTSSAAAAAAVHNQVPSTSATSIPTSGAQAAQAHADAGVNGVPPAKKPRSRSVRAPAVGKKAAKIPDEPTDQEDIEKRVQDIVQIALQVDKSAKSNAEKERKSRSSEKRARDKQAAAAAAAAAAATAANSNPTAVPSMPLPSPSRKRPSTESSSGAVPAPTASQQQQQGTSASAVTTTSAPMYQLPRQYAGQQAVQQQASASPAVAAPCIQVQQLATSVPGPQTPSTPALGAAVPSLLNGENMKQLSEFMKLVMNASTGSNPNTYLLNTAAYLNGLTTAQNDLRSDSVPLSTATQAALVAAAAGSGGAAPGSLQPGQSQMQPGGGQF